MQEESREIELVTVIVQLNSIYKSPKETFEKKVNPFLAAYLKKPKDIIVFPEMALTGYDFEKKEDVLPLCEQAGKGYHFDVASTIAKVHKSYVLMGYPEKYVDCEGNETLYNSCIIVDRNGELVLNYRKILLFDVDKRYFEPGSQRNTFMLETLKGDKLKCAPAICMDINYKDFKNYNETPLADFLAEESVDVLLFPTAWTEWDIDVSKPVSAAKNRKVLSEVLTYWADRLYPWIESSSK